MYLRMLLTAMMLPKKNKKDSLLKLKKNAEKNPENLLTNIIENKKQVKIFHNLRVKNQIKIQAV